MATPKVTKIDDDTVEYYCQCGKHFAKITVDAEGNPHQDTFIIPEKERVNDPEPKPTPEERKRFFRPRK